MKRGSDDIQSGKLQSGISCWKTRLASQRKQRAAPTTNTRIEQVGVKAT
jgi:hypothetical protein